MTANDTMSTLEAAKALGISVRTAQLWVEEGRLAAWKTAGGHRRILRRSVEAMLDLRKRAVSIEVRPKFEILVVEDERLQRQIYETKLGELGPDVAIRSAENGYEGLIKIGETPPDLLLSDLVMPGIDGFAMLRMLASNPVFRPMQIIVVSALTPEEIKDSGGLPVGVTVFQKPVPLQQLIRLVEAHREIWLQQRRTK